MKSILLKDVMVSSIVSCLLFIPFLGHVHLFDWDEINFAECREMLVLDDFTRVHIDLDLYNCTDWGWNMINGIGIITLPHCYGS